MGLILTNSNICQANKILAVVNMTEKTSISLKGAGSSITSDYTPPCPAFYMYNEMLPTAARSHQTFMPIDSLPNSCQERRGVLRFVGRWGGLEEQEGDIQRRNEILLGDLNPSHSHTS